LIETRILCHTILVTPFEFDAVTTSHVSISSFNTFLWVEIKIPIDLTVYAKSTLKIMKYK